jgi:hypothetical protein
MNTKAIPAGQLAALGIALLLAACATMQTGSDQHPAAAFGSYATYAWISDEPLIRPRDPELQISALTVRRIQEAIDSGLAAKRYRRIDAASQADFVVSFTVGARDRIDAESYPVPYRGPWLWRWSAHDVDVQVYREGTLSIDIFDGDSRQPVWHGWARKTITEADEANPGPAIDKAVGKILRRFPSRAP